MSDRVAVINGVETPAPEGAVAWKYADPTEDARWIYSRREMAEIARDDPSLIVRVTHRPPRQWTPAEVRAWIERHGGNVSAQARRLRVPRGSLQAWAGGSRPTPPYIVALMEALDELAGQTPETEGET